MEAVGEPVFKGSVTNRDPFEPLHRSIISLADKVNELITITPGMR